MLNMKLDQAGRDFIMKHEGIIPYEYFCQAKVPTIGIGVTTKNLTPEELGKLKYISLSELKQIKDVPPVIFNGEVRTIDKDTIESIFTRMITTFEKAVNKHVKVPITQNQFNALVSFAYNVGIGNAKKGFRSYDRIPNKIPTEYIPNAERLLNLITKISHKWNGSKIPYTCAYRGAKFSIKKWVEYQIHYIKKPVLWIVLFS